MLGCAELKYETAEQAAAWNAKVAAHLFNLDGLMGRW